jgi:prolyl 4-hydroxylase
MTATVQPITPELRRWIVEQAEIGRPSEDIVQAMRDSGWHEEVARAALAETLRASPAVVAAPVSMSTGAVPEPLADGVTSLVADGHTVQVLMTLRHPHVVVFGGFLTPSECEALIEEAQSRLERSETVQQATGGSEVNVARTSDGMFFKRGESELIARIERRIEALVRWPVSHGEGLQVLRYRPGAQYQAHFDYFDPTQPGTARILERGGQRVGTLVMYLREPLGGGATIFPDIGLEVAPVQGQAVFFSYDRPHPSTGSLHGGAPVLAGEKWVATKWLRQGVFD